MKIIFLFAIITGLSFNSFAIFYKVGHTTLSYADTAKQGREITAEVYYPADADGENAGFSKHSVSKYPVICFGHGFVMKWDAYQYLWESLAASGYIVAFSTTESSLFPNHEVFSKDLASIIKQVLKLGSTPNSIFYQKVDTMNCVMGHSMGGGAAFLAAGGDKSIKAIVTLAPAETKPSAIGAASNISIPALVFAGVYDCITPTIKHQLPMYNALHSNNKTYIAIKGGSHCFMAESSPTCNFGEATCSPKPTIARSQQHEIILKYLLPWLDYNLRNNKSAQIELSDNFKADTSIIVQRNW